MVILVHGQETELPNYLAAGERQRAEGRRQEVGLSVEQPYCLWSIWVKQPPPTFGLAVKELLAGQNPKGLSPGVSPGACTPRLAIAPSADRRPPTAFFNFLVRSIA